jgi:hypothetical protein
MERKEVKTSIPWNVVIEVNQSAINEFPDIECKIATAEELIYAILKMSVNENQEQAIEILEKTKIDFIRLTPENSGK